MAQDIAGTEAFTNGPYTKPTDGDKGDNIFDRLEEFMDRMAAHSHSGADSNSISLNIQKDIEDLVEGSTIFWVDLGSNQFEATVAVPAGTSYDLSIRKFFVGEDGNFNEFYPTVEKISTSSFKVFASEAIANLRVVTL